MKQAKEKKDHHLVKRRNTWYFFAKVNKKRIRLALSQSLTEARRLRDEKLREILIHGNLLSKGSPQDDAIETDRGPLFGEVAQDWAKDIEKKIKLSTMTDYRYTMNGYILPRFGNMPIREIGHKDIRQFASNLACSPKRINNILVPMRSVFKMALDDETIDSNPMAKIKNGKVGKADIYPLAMEEIKLFLENVSPRYKDFFIVAFFTGMRFGEMAGLKWRNVDYRLGIIKVRLTRVMGEEGRPKTKKSFRDIKMLPPVVDAMKHLKKQTFGKSEYVFLNQYKVPLDPSSTNFHVWKPALKKAGLEARSLYQTRHTFATLMLDAGEHPGWVQKMMGHETLQMIYDHYYSYIKSYDRNEGSTFMEKVYNPINSSNHEDATAQSN